MKNIYSQSLEYHAKGRKGKIEVIPSKPVSTQLDLSLAYSPGVAEPCRMIAEKPELAYKYTAKGNLVAVVSNGSAVLGLGNIGPDAAKPVMEGKGILFKKLADIDVFDIELRTNDPDEIIHTCRLLEPTFGGINLEDIKAPECFYIEEKLRESLKIPVFHDDQHGTAVISASAFLNALELIHKKIDEVKVVMCGGGAAAIACATLYLQLGVRKENLTMVDSIGVIYEGRSERMNPYKARFARKTELRTLGEAMVGADAFVGVSVKDCLTAEMIEKMTENPIIFAMANPDPEIAPEVVEKVRPDALLATGRSDYPNQVNNVLGFPYIFKGALDTRSITINEEMKFAAVKALAELAKEDIPDSVMRAYGGQKFRFGREYLIPKPFDRRALLWVAPAVAKAAMDTGVARIQVDLNQYRESLETLLGASYTVMRNIKRRVKKKYESTQENDLVKLVFPEGEHPKILRAAHLIKEEQIAQPILLGRKERIEQWAKDEGLDSLLKSVQVINPQKNSLSSDYAEKLYEIRCRKGVTLSVAQNLIRQQFNYFGTMMVRQGHADGLLSGLTYSYPETIRPALQIIGHCPGDRLVGIYMMICKGKLYWFADTTINIDPTAEELADIAIQTSRFAASYLSVEPRVALLSFSNFGSNNHPFAQKVRKALELVRARHPHLMIDGEMQADTALFSEISKENFPFNRIPGDANVLIFPDLQSGNIAYKLLSKLGDAEAIGPILTGMRECILVLQRGSDVNDIVNMASIAAMEIQLGLARKSIS